MKHKNNAHISSRRAVRRYGGTLLVLHNIIPKFMTAPP
jgi:hypothetical protein